MSGSKLTLALNRAISSYQAGQLGEAEQICQKIISKKSNFFDAHHVLAVVQASQGKNDLALTSYNRALAVQPNHAGALNNRGVTLHVLGRFDEALANFDHALVLQADYVDALCNRGNTLHALKRFDEALANYDRAIVLRPGVVEA